MMDRFDAIVIAGGVLLVTAVALLWGWPGLLGLAGTLLVWLGLWLADRASERK